MTQRKTILAIGFAFAVLASTASTAAAVKPAKPAPVEIFILAGQSNMVGFGLPLQEETPSPRILKVLSTGLVVPTVDPVFAYDQTTMSDARPGVGPGYSFARALTARDKSMRVALAPCAASGTTIAQWQKGQPLYDACLASVEAAVKHGGKLGGVLFFQGESDAGSSPDVSTLTTWPAMFTSYVAAIRHDLGKTVPIVFAQMQTAPPTWPQWMQDAYATMRTQQAAIRLPGVSMIQTSDLPYGVDVASNLHFSPSAETTIGQRFASAWLKLRGLRSN